MTGVQTCLFRSEQEEQREILALKRLDAENLQIRFVFRLLIRRLFKYVITYSYLHFTEVPFFLMSYLYYFLFYTLSSHLNCCICKQNIISLVFPQFYFTISMFFMAI